MMTPLAEETWELRAPFPDEEARLRRHFAAGRSDAAGASRSLWRQVLVAGPRQRLVGLVELRPAAPPAASGESPAGPRLQLVCELRSAWQGGEAARLILDSAEARARELGAAELDFAGDPRTPIGPRLLAAGFEEIHRRERWRVPVAGALVWMKERGDRHLEGRAPTLVSTHGLPLGQLRDVCVATRLLTAEQVARYQPGMGHGFDDDFSFALPGPDRLDAVLLAREQFGRLYLEILARHPDAKDAPFLTTIALFREFFRQAERRGHEEVYCEITPAKTPGILRAVVLGQGAPHAILATFRKRL